IKQQFKKNQKQNKQYKEKIKSKKFDSKFIAYSSDADKYGNLSSMLSLISGYIYNNKEKKDRVSKMLQFNIQPYFEGIEVERPELMDNLTYTRFLDSYLNYQLLKKQGTGFYEKREGNQSLLDKLALLKSGVFSKAEINSYFAYALAKSQLRMHRLEGADAILAYYQKHKDIANYRKKRIEGILDNIHATNEGQKISNYTFIN